MSQFPIIRFDLEGIRHSVMTAIHDHNYIEDTIKEQLEVALTEEWVTQKISEAVNDCLHNAIRELSDHYGLKSIIQDALISVVKDKIQPDKAQPGAEV